MNSRIRKVLSALSGTSHIGRSPMEIEQYVYDNIEFEEGDFDPYPTGSATDTRIKHAIRAALENMKKEGLLLHDEMTHLRYFV